MPEKRTAKELLEEIKELRERCEEAEETLRAIRSGEVDALVVGTKQGERTFTLEGADSIYRTAIENIKEGVITLSPDGTILYSNHYFAQMIDTKLGQVIGASFFNFVPSENRDATAVMLLQENARAEISLCASDGTRVPCYMTTTKLNVDNPTICAVVTDLTQQKRDEEIIAQARLLQSILAQSAEGIIICDASGTIIETSFEAQKLVGHYIVGRKFKDEFKILHTDDSPVTLWTLQTGKIPDKAKVKTVYNGDERTYLLSYAKLAVEETLLGHVITLTDITQMIKAEEALKESEERFRSVLDNSRDVIFRVNLETGRYEYVSPSSKTVVGYSPDELMTLNVENSLAMVYPDDLKALQTAQSLSEETGRAEVEYRQRAKNGDYRWISSRMSVIKDKDGRPSYRIGNLRDVTQNKEAEAALRENEEKFLKIFYSSPVPQIITSLSDGRCVEVNDSFLGLTEYTKEEIVGKKINELKIMAVIPGDLDLTTFLETGNLPNHEIIDRTKSGKRITLLASANRITINGEEHSISTIIDITERKQTEEALEKREIELEALNKELESFSYSVSHDLRAPLRSLAGFSGALLADYPEKLDEQGKLYLRKIGESAELMAKLIDDLLKLAIVSRAEMSPEKINLSEMAQKIIGELQSVEPGRKVKVTIAPGLIASGDRILLRRVLDNLLGNAWKYTGKTKEPQIEIGVVDHNGKPSYFVRDNGVGFDMAYAHKLFQPFQRLHATTEFSGTGIGLAIVQRIIHRHGGDVWAEGKVGEGATFYFTLD